MTHTPTNTPQSRAQASARARATTVRAGRSRISKGGAVVTAVILFGSAVLAPLSIPSSRVTEAAAAPEAAAETARSAQTLLPAAVETAAIDLTVPVSETRPAAGASRTTAAGGAAATPALYTLDQFMFTGAVNWSGYRFTFYSQQVLPGPGLEIPGRHVSDAGYVSDADGYIVLAGSAAKGTVFETPFGHPGKIYDRGTFGNHLDVYIR